jgi:Zn-dependent peptidase ImmA (M78 family)
VKQALFTPSTAAIKLSHWLDAAAKVGLTRFPVDVKELALSVGAELRWSDTIYTVERANISGFEGGLFYVPDKGWALLYNEEMKSTERIRFTLAHELGHYLVHRMVQQKFECAQADMVHWGPDQKAIESQADDFAANLLMPMNHFVPATGSSADFDRLSDASAKFGVSLTAAALRWITSTDQSAVLILARDGFMDWSVSTDKARKNGAYFKTKGKVVELPSGTLAADDSVGSNRQGERRPLRSWFEHAHKDAEVLEMKLFCGNYGYSLSLLILSSGEKVWDPDKAPWLHH